MTASESDPTTGAQPPRLLRVLAWLPAVVAFFGFGALGAFLTAAGLAIAAFGSDFRSIEFDPQLWNRPDWKASYSRETSFHSIRQRMVDDLLEEHLPLGLSRDEVVERIGPQDDDAHFRPEPGAWVYFLGAERALGIDGEWLVLEFDDQGILTGARLAWT